MPVFAPYGEIEKVSLVRGPDNKSRGCCMVSGGAARPGCWLRCCRCAAAALPRCCRCQLVLLPMLPALTRAALPTTPLQVQFKRWSDAERAMHAVNGTSPLETGKGRPLVCHFANPRRSAAGSQMSETAIAPRKLFVGQASPQRGWGGGWGRGRMLRAPAGMPPTLRPSQPQRALMLPLPALPPPRPSLPRSPRRAWRRMCWPCLRHTARWSKSASSSPRASMPAAPLCRCAAGACMRHGSTRAGAGRGCVWRRRRMQRPQGLPLPP